MWNSPTPPGCLGRTRTRYEPVGKSHSTTWLTRSGENVFPLCLDGTTSADPSPVRSSRLTWVVADMEILCRAAASTANSNSWTCWRAERVTGGGITIHATTLSPPTDGPAGCGEPTNK